MYQPNRTLGGFVVIQETLKSGFGLQDRRDTLRGTTEDTRHGVLIMPVCLTGEVIISSIKFLCKCNRKTLMKIRKIVQFLLTAFSKFWMD